MHFNRFSSLSPSTISLTDFVAGLTDFVAGLTDFIAGLTDFIAELTDFIAGSTDSIAGLTDFIASILGVFDGSQGVLRARCLLNVVETCVKNPHFVHSYVLRGRGIKGNFKRIKGNFKRIKGNFKRIKGRRGVPPNLFQFLKKNIFPQITPFEGRGARGWIVWVSRKVVFPITRKPGFRARNGTSVPERNRSKRALGD